MIVSLKFKPKLRDISINLIINLSEKVLTGNMQNKEAYKNGPRLSVETGKEWQEEGKAKLP